MADKIQLTPAELLAQSQEMASLQNDFESLFKQTESVLGQVNENWSANLANNFSGKLQSAQRAFSQVTAMLGQGSGLAATSANTYESMDSLLAKAMGGDLLQGAGGAAVAVGSIVNAPGMSGFVDFAKQGLGDFFKNEWENLKEGWSASGDFLEWADSKYQELPGGVRNTIEKALGGTLTTTASITYDIITGNVSWDTAEDFISEVSDSSTAQAIIGALQYALDGGVMEQLDEYEQHTRELLSEGNVLAGINNELGAFADIILAGSVDIVGDIGIGVIEDLPLVGLMTDALGFDLSDTWDRWMESAHQGISAWTEWSTEAIAEFEENVQETVSGMVDTVTDVAADVWDAASDALDAAGDWIADILPW